MLNKFYIYKMLLKEILEGWGNWILDKLKLVDPQTKEIAKLRLLVCDTCPIRTGHICSPNKSDVHVITGETKFGCGCAIPAKTLSLDSKCPLGKW